MRTCATCIYCLRRSEEGILSHGAGATSSCEPSDTGAANWTLTLSSTSRCSSRLSHVSSPLMRGFKCISFSNLQSSGEMWYEKSSCLELGTDDGRRQVFLHPPLQAFSALNGGCLLWAFCTLSLLCQDTAWLYPTMHISWDAGYRFYNKNFIRVTCGVFQWPQRLKHKNAPPQRLTYGYF